MDYVIMIIVMLFVFYGIVAVWGAYEAIRYAKFFITKEEWEESAIYELLDDKVDEMWPAYVILLPAGAAFFWPIGILACIYIAVMYGGRYLYEKHNQN